MTSSPAGRETLAPDSAPNTAPRSASYPSSRKIRTGSAMWRPRETERSTPSMFPASYRVTAMTLRGPSDSMRAKVRAFPGSAIPTLSNSPGSTVASKAGSKSELHAARRTMKTTSGRRRETLHLVQTGFMIFIVAA